MICYLFTYIVFTHYFIIDTNTWLCIRFFLQSTEYIKGTLCMDVDTRKVRISFYIITIWCIQIIWFATVDVIFRSSISPLLILGKNLPVMFSSWRRKRHTELFFYCKTVPRYNQNELENWEYVQCNEHRVFIYHVKNLMINSIVFKNNWQIICLCTDVH